MIKVADAEVTRTELQDADGLATRLDQNGLCVFRGQSEESVRAAFESVADLLSHRDSDVDHVTRLKVRPEVMGRSGYDGFTAKYMPPHTDGSGLEEPPEVIGVVCKVVAEHGGAALLVDGACVVSALQSRAPQSVQRLMIPGTAAFGSNRFLGSVLTSCASSRFYIRYRDDGLADYAAVDGEVAALRELIKESTLRLELNAGDGYFLQNGRWLHGREAFSGPRELLRLLGRFKSSATIDRAVRFGFELFPLCDFGSIP